MLQVSTLLPSTRTAPAVGFHTPTSVLIRLDLPDPLGPSTATAEPASISKLTSVRVWRIDPGGMSDTLSTESDRSGGGNGSTGGRAGTSLKSASIRAQPWRAASMERQVAMM